ncbi:hypothetical protein N826_04705 [Skermanella aerolata KACC 11604]|nr:hypothetical protein N826_04705 [Skermanella aerolata KACC 11604]
MELAYQILTLTKPDKQGRLLSLQLGVQHL